MSNESPSATGWLCTVATALLALLGTAAAAVPQRALPADASVLDVMMERVVPDSTAIFDVADPPARPEGWVLLRSHAVALREAGDLLLSPSRARDQKEWTAEVRAYVDAATRTAKAAETKNFDALLEASDALAATCATCHAKYPRK